MFTKTSMVDTFRKLVQIDSNSGEEREMADLLTRELKQLGCKVIEDNTGEIIEGNAGNIIALLKGDKNYPVLMLSAHMDRVEPGSDIKPVIKDDYIVSGGNTILAADDLAGVTGILESLKAIKENNIPHGDIKIIFTVAEELGLLGAKYLENHHLQDIDMGIVYDAEGKIGKIIYKGPAKAKFNAVIRGKSSHSGINPGKGINAIKISSLAISAMNIGEIDKETTANIGVIRGGIARNIVPDLVELEGEARSLNSEKLEQQLTHMKSVIEKYVDKYKGGVEFDIEHLYQNYSLKKDSALIKMLKSAAEEADIKPEFNTSCGGNDANIFNDRGIPSVNIAVGAENVHTKNEKLKIDYLSELVKFTVNIIKKSREF
ncbi:MAG: M20/M25/M40 family metallo-hydrolase [Bacillota bacterium]